MNHLYKVCTLLFLVSPDECLVNEKQISLFEWELFCINCRKNSIDACNHKISLVIPASLSHCNMIMREWSMCQHVFNHPRPKAPVVGTFSFDQWLFSTNKAGYTTRHKSRLLGRSSNANFRSLNEWTDRRMDGPMDGWTDRWTDTPSYRVVSHD